MSYKLHQKHDLQRSTCLENNCEFSLRSHHTNTATSMLVEPTTVKIKVTVSTHNVLHADNLMVDAELSLPDSEHTGIDSDEEVQDFTKLTLLATSIAAAIKQLPNASRTWALYLDDLKVTKEKRLERIQRKSETLLQFMERFPVTEL